jgi:transcriptional regulator with XRE-family HTH domain
MTDRELMKSTRKALGLTQSQMAEKLGYQHQKDISNIERGVRAMSNQARKLVETIIKYELPSG